MGFSYLRAAYDNRAILVGLDLVPKVEAPNLSQSVFLGMVAALLFAGYYISCIQPIMKMGELPAFCL
ncbi:hypothetical protein KJ765_00190 [Candidatus Micrarchaeota archaeon]|nr:hypothetical protein [Candidatus Micrarchaeota archaeon]